MELKEILALEANPNSLKKIDRFLSTKDIIHRDYAPALAHLAYLSFQLGKVSEAFKILFDYLEVCEDKYKAVIYSTLIKIYYSQKDFDSAYKAIEVKKSFLPRYNKANYYEDLITYYQLLDNKEELIRTILIYLEDDISDERRLKALLLLSESYLKLHEYQKFKDKNMLIESLSLTLKEDSIYLEARFNEAFVLEKEKEYDKALKIVETLLESKLDNILLAKVLTLKLVILISLKEYRKASIFEAEFEKTVDLGLIDTRILFAKTCISLYQELNNQFNCEVYDAKLTNLMNEKADQTNIKQETKKKNTKAQKIELNFAQSKAIVEEKKEEVKEINEETKHSTYSFIEQATRFEEMVSLINQFNAKDYSSFREFLRLYFTEVNKIAYFDEAYILINHYGYHFKKERLYDKKTVNLENTVENKLLTQDEIILYNLEAYDDILTNNKYQESYRILGFNFNSYLITFRGLKDDLINLKMNYETLKLAASYLVDKVNIYQKLVQKDKEDRHQKFILDKLIYGYHRTYDNIIYLSKSLQDLLNLADRVNVSEFYQYFDSQDLIEYKKNLSELLELPNIYRKVSYKLKINEMIYHFEERLLANEDGEILGVVEEVTDRIKHDEEITNFAYVDTIAKVYTKTKLDLDLTDLIASKKFSLVAFNVINFKLYNELYGMEFGDQLIFAIGKYLKEYPKLDLGIYHFDGDKFVISVKNINDKRAIKKIALDIAEYLNLKLRTLNYRVNLKFKMGILRYPTDTLDHNHQTIINYLMSALSNASCDLNDHGIGFYDLERYKRDIFEIELTTHISESIDLNHLKIEYQQVVNLKDNTSEHYIPHLNLSNYAVKEAEIYRVLKKRKMVFQLEKYLIHKTLFELLEMYKETKRYFSVVFKVSEETLKGENFLLYVIEQLKFFNIPKSAIMIYYNDSCDEEAINILKAFEQNEIMIATSNIELIKNVRINYFYYQLPNYVQSLENEFLVLVKAFCDQKTIQFIVDQVNNKNVITRFIDLGCYLFSGKVYGALLTKDEIVKAFLA